MNPSSYESRTMAQVKRYLDKYPHAQSLPSYLDSALDKLERLYKEPDITKLPVFNIYQFENQLENDLSSKNFRHGVRQQLADYIEMESGKVAYVTRDIVELPEKLRRCRSSGTIGITPEGRHVTAWDDHLNNVRLCPDEAREEGQRVYKKYCPVILNILKQNPDCRLFYAVYTVPNAPLGGLLEGKKNLHKRFSNYHRSKWAKKCIKGSFVISEDPLSARNDWNIHINAIHIVKGDFSYKQLRREWGYNAEVQEIKGTPEDIAKAFLECVKYVAKHVGEKSEDSKHNHAPGMTSWPWDAWEEWYRAGRGFRRSRSYGCLYRVPTVTKGLTLDEIEWVGQVKHTGYEYQVFLKDLSSLSVDLIQGDNFATGDGVRHSADNMHSADQGRNYNYLN